MEIQKLIAQAEQLLKRGKLSDAAEKFEEALQSDPQNEVVANRLALTYSEMGETSKAIGIYCQVARRASEKGKNQKALVLYKQALAMDANDPRSRLGIAEESEQLGKFSDAVAVSEDLINFYLPRKKYLDILGACARIGRCDPAHEESKEIMIEVLRVLSDENRLRTALVMLCGPPGLVSNEQQVGGDPRNISQKVLGALISLMDWFPSDPALPYSLAWVAYRSQNFRESLRFLTEAFRRDPDYHLTSILFARILVELEKLPESQFVFRYVKENIARDHRTAIKNLNDQVATFEKANGWMAFADGLTGTGALSPRNFLAKIRGEALEEDPDEKKERTRTGLIAAGGPEREIRIPGFSEDSSSPENTNSDFEATSLLSMSGLQTAPPDEPEEAPLPDSPSEGLELETNQRPTKAAAKISAPPVAPPKRKTPTPVELPEQELEESIPAPPGGGLDLSDSINGAAEEPAGLVIAAGDDEDAPETKTQLFSPQDLVQAGKWGRAANAKVGLPEVTKQSVSIQLPTMVPGKSPATPPVAPPAKPPAKPPGLPQATTESADISFEVPKREDLPPGKPSAFQRLKNFAGFKSQPLDVGVGDAPAEMPIEAVGEQVSEPVAESVVEQAQEAESSTPPEPPIIPAQSIESDGEATVIQKLATIQPALSVDSDDEATVIQKFTADAPPPPPKPTLRFDDNFVEPAKEQPAVSVDEDMEATQIQRAPVAQEPTSVSIISTKPKIDLSDIVPPAPPTPAKEEAKVEPTIRPFMLDPSHIQSALDQRAQDLGISSPTRSEALGAPAASQAVSVELSGMTSLQPEVAKKDGASDLIQIEDIGVKPDIEEEIDRGSDLLRVPVVSNREFESEGTRHFLQQVPSETKDYEKLFSVGDSYLDKNNYYLARKSYRKALEAGAPLERVHAKLREIRRLEFPDGIGVVPSDDAVTESVAEIIEGLERDFEIDFAADEPGFDIEKQARSLREKIDAQVSDRDPRLRIDLGVAFYEMGLYKEAENQFLSALGKNETLRFDAAYLAAQAMYARRDYAGCIELLATLLEEPGKSDKEKIAVFYLLGCAYQANSNGEESLNYFTKTAAIDSNFRDVRERLQRLNIKNG